MSIITSNQPKRQTIVDPILILFLSVVAVLLIFAISTTNKYHFTSNVLQTYDAAPASLSLNGVALFASDQRYWSEYCETGWSGDATCDAIVLRTQGCSARVDSAYCSAYESYLQELK